MPGHFPIENLNGHHGKQVQQIILNGPGQVLASDDIIFPINKLAGRSIFEHFPFFEEIWPSLVFSKEKQSETVFPCLQMAEPERFGMYDFHFLSIFWGEEPAISCTIVERTAHYSLRRDLQQLTWEHALTHEKGAFAR